MKYIKMFEENQDDIIFLIKSFKTNEVIVKIYCDSDGRYIKCEKPLNISEPLWKVGEKLFKYRVEIYADIFLSGCTKDVKPILYVEQTTEFETDYKNYNL